MAMIGVIVAHAVYVEERNSKYGAKLPARIAMTFAAFIWGCGATAMFGLLLVVTIHGVWYVLTGHPAPFLRGALP
jgi:hypothetical protein